jgi:hypothetical protein
MSLKEKLIFWEKVRARVNDFAQVQVLPVSYDINEVVNAFTEKYYSDDDMASVMIILDLQTPDWDTIERTVAELYVFGGSEEPVDVIEGSLM